MQGQIASIRCNAFPKNRTDVLKSYIRDRWVYVAMRIDPGALTTDNEQKLRRGELQPVRFRFPARESVYALRISSLNAGKTEVLLYLLADQPLAYASGPTNAMVRAGVVRNPNCPTDVIRQLAKDDNPQVKEALVKKADTPPDIPVALAATMDRYVLFCLSGRAEVPTEALRFMYRVAGNPRTPAAVLRELTKDSDAGIAGAAQRTLQLRRLVE